MMVRPRDETVAGWVEVDKASARKRDESYDSPLPCRFGREADEDLS
jgi:hypothetical protein